MHAHTLDLVLSSGLVLNYLSLLELCWSHTALISFDIAFPVSSYLPCPSLPLRRVINAQAAALFVADFSVSDLPSVVQLR